MKTAQIEAILPQSATEYTIQARLLTNKEFCSECAAGRGCGAIYMNQLTSAGRNKNLVEFSLAKEIVERDFLQINDLIKIDAQQRDFWKSLLALYVLPLLGAILLPVVILSMLQVHELIILGTIGVCCLGYYLWAHKRWQNYQAPISYVGKTSYTELGSCPSSSNIKDLSADE